MVNYACGFNQSEMGKYFECIITNFMRVMGIRHNLPVGTIFRGHKL